jgi:hypothetical protein
MFGIELTRGQEHAVDEGIPEPEFHDHHQRRESNAANRADEPSLVGQEISPGERHRKGDVAPGRSPGGHWENLAWGHD